jgi:hypothetical protein
MYFILTCVVDYSLLCFTLRRKKSNGIGKPPKKEWGVKWSWGPGVVALHSIAGFEKNR